MLSNIKNLSLTKKLAYKIVFFIFCLIPFFSGLDSIPPLDRDESRFVQSTYQMIETNDYINIKFLDEIRAKKPIGIYWAQSIFANIFGEDKISSYRYVSTLGALITILVLWKFSQILFGQKASLFVVSASMISLLFIFESHVAKTDTLLLSFITFQQYLLLKIILNKKKSILFDLIIPISMWLVLGIGFLIKGPISLVVFIFTLSSYVLWNKDINLLKNIRPFWGIICFMIIVLPWVFIIQKTTDGLFFQKAISEDFLPKLLSEQESHGGYPGYYFLISSLIFWPVASFFPLAFFFVKNNLTNLNFNEPNNIAVMNVECGNVIIELYPDISPKAVERFKILIEKKMYDGSAFYKVSENTFVQAGDIEYGNINNLDYSKIGSGKSGLGLLKSELNNDFKFIEGSVGFARTTEFDTEDSEFFITLKEIPIYQGEYTPIGKVVYGLDILTKIKTGNKAIYVLRPDYIKTFRLLNSN